MDSNNINFPIVISYETDTDNKNYILYKKTLENNKWDYKFIGQGLKWNGFRDKIIGYYNEIQKYPDNKIFILTDARDVFCLRSSKFLMDKINNIIDTKIIISAELYLRGNLNWTTQQIEDKLKIDPTYFYQGVQLIQYFDYYNKSDSLPSRKYLNSGLIIGKASNLKTMFKWCIDNNYNDDQLALAEYTNKFPEQIYLDYDANFLHTSTAFVNCSTSNFNIQIQDSPTFQELSGMTSYFLHIPGKGIGQTQLYNMIYNLFNNNLIKNLYSLYNIQPHNDKDGVKNIYFVSN